MISSNSLLAFSALSMGALAHHRNLIGRADSTASASIPQASSWDPPSDMVEALDQVGAAKFPRCDRLLTWNTQGLGAHSVREP